MTRIALLVGCLLPTVCALGEELRTSPLAEAFGAYPALWDVRLSPDGKSTSQIQLHADGTTQLSVIDVAAGTRQVVMSGQAGAAVLSACGWANDARLLCAVRANVGPSPLSPSLTRINVPPTPGNVTASMMVVAAVDRDGSNPKNLFHTWPFPSSPFKLPIIAWSSQGGTSALVRASELTGKVSELDVVTGEIEEADGAGAVAVKWIADERGVARVFATRAGKAEHWFVRDSVESDWRRLHERDLDDPNDAFRPLGFGASGNTLFYEDWHDGRLALFSMDLDRDAASQLVFSAPRADIEAVGGIGPGRALAFATYEHGMRQHVFNEHAASIVEKLRTVFDDSDVFVVDADAGRANYLVLVAGANGAGTYYHYDVAAGLASLVSDAFPSLRGIRLADTRPVSYTADGVEIPAHLVLPEEGKATGRAVVLPSEGMETAQSPGFDYLAQFLAAHGYVVLRSGHRGSRGYGRDWQGDGPFEAWERAVADLASGADWLVEAGLADSQRVCTVGWNAGGYVSYMAAVERADRFRCAASIGGLAIPTAPSDPATIIWDGRPDRNGRPSLRAKDLSVPLLLVYAHDEQMAPYASAEDVAAALQRHGKAVSSIVYEDANALGAPQRYRIDMLTRLAEFLDEHIR